MLSVVRLLLLLVLCCWMLCSVLVVVLYSCSCPQSVLLLCALRLSQMGQTNKTGQPDGAMLDLAVRAVRTLSRWTATIKELYAWKLAHPMDKYKNHEWEGNL